MLELLEVVLTALGVIVFVFLLTLAIGWAVSITDRM